MIRVLLIGATGVFGSRLAKLISQESGIALILAGRTEAALKKLQSEISATTEIALIDREQITAYNLTALHCDLVIDAAGPFFAGNTRVIEAAIEAGIHYVDLADGRAFVRDVVKFNQPALAKNIAVIVGASTIPALSHAVIDALTHGWLQYDHLTVGIFPGNRAPRGLAVVQSILQYVGKPVRVFRQGAWQHVYGWGLTHRVKVPYVGKRWASVCDTPDQDLLVSRYRPTSSAEFFAGMELSLMHLGLALLSLPVRWGWLNNLSPFAQALLWAAKKLLPFGSDKGGMTIDIDGLDANGQPQHLAWALSADANRGPNVPTLSAFILVKQLRDGNLHFRGAGACVGMISLHEFEQAFSQLGLKTTTRSDALAATTDGNCRLQPRLR